MYMYYEFFNKIFNSAYLQAKRNDIEHAIAIRLIQDYANFRIFKKDRFENLLTENDLRDLDVKILQVAFSQLGYICGFFDATKNDKFTNKQIQEAFGTLSFILEEYQYYFELEEEVLITDSDSEHELALKMNK